MIERIRRRIALLWDALLFGFLFRRPMERFYVALGGHIFFQTLRAASRLDLFTLLAEHPGLTSAEIAGRLGLREQPARILLLGCTSLGLLRKRGGRFRNSFTSSRLLVRQSPTSIRSIIEWQHAINYRPLQKFTEALQAGTNVGLTEIPGTGETLYERLEQNPELEAVFQDAMEDISVQANALLLRFCDFSGTRRLVDVGGGNGSNIITLARAYPEMRATVFDLPSVCAIARERIAREGMADRLDAVEGDCFRDPFPTGADCILFSHFFTIWSPEKDRLLLRKSFEALPPGGRVVLFNMMQWNNGAGPLTAAMGSPYFLTLATGEGMLYAWEEYETWMREAGFTRIRKTRLPRDHGVLSGIKP